MKVLKVGKPTALRVNYVHDFVPFLWAWSFNHRTYSISPPLIIVFGGGGDRLLVQRW